MQLISSYFTRITPLAFALLIMVFSFDASAEEPLTTQTTPPPNNPYVSAEGQNAAPVVSSAPAEPQCIPGCRSGFFCRTGTCLSLCNPPCPTGEKCTEYGQCAGDSKMLPIMVMNEPELPVAPRKSGVQKHDGFMLRVAFGVGGAYTKRTPKNEDESDLNVSGMSGSFSIDIGASPVENLVLHGRISNMVMIRPIVSLDGKKKAETADIVLFSAALIGPAMTYYFMPINLYLTGAIGLSRLSVAYEREENEEEWTRDYAQGIALNIDVGKEWWISNNWGFGLAGRLWYTRVSAKSDVGRNFIGGAVLFSATYQ
jgi:hypothetical protein